MRILRNRETSQRRKTSLRWRVSCATHQSSTKQKSKTWLSDYAIDVKTQDDTVQHHTARCAIHHMLIYLFINYKTNYVNYRSTGSMLTISICTYSIYIPIVGHSTWVARNRYSRTLSVCGKIEMIVNGDTMELSRCVHASDGPQRFPFFPRRIEEECIRLSFIFIRLNASQSTKRSHFYVTFEK